MRKPSHRKNHFTNFAQVGSLSVICFSFLVACSDDPTPKTVSAEKSTSFTQISSGASKRALGQSDTVNINQVFGAGFIQSNNTDANLTGAFGNAGGFGFGGSIASIIGNIGGFGFGGFGTFASFFAGEMPAAPPNGLLVPPTGLGPIPPGGFTPPSGLPPGIINGALPTPAGPGNAALPPGLSNGSLPPGLGGALPPGLADGTLPPGLGGALPPGLSNGSLPPGLGGTLPPGLADGTLPPGLGGALPPGLADGTLPPGLGGTLPPGLSNGSLPPGLGGALPPGLGNGAFPPGFGNGASPPIGGITAPPFGPIPIPTPPPTAPPIPGLASVVDSNLSELSTPLSNLDIDLLFVTENQTVADTSEISILAITETVIDCAGGGTITRIVDDVDPVGMSSGDTRTTVFNNCIRSATGSRVIDGSRGFSVDEITGTPFIDPTWSMQSTMFKNQLTKTDTATGNSRFSDGTTTTGISVLDNNLISQFATGTGAQSRKTATQETVSNYNFDMNFDWDVAANNYIIQFNAFAERITALQEGSSSNVETRVPFSGALGQPPTAGQLVHTKLVNNVATRIVSGTAQADGTVLLEIDSDGDGIVDTTTTEPSWGPILFSAFNG